MPRALRISAEKQAGSAPKVKKIVVPSHTAAFMIPMNRKTPITPERYGKRAGLPSLETGDVLRIA
jgi:hypothetical protein